MQQSFIDQQLYLNEIANALIEIAFNLKEDKSPNPLLIEDNKLKLNLVIAIKRTIFKIITKIEVHNIAESLVDSVDSVSPSPTVAAPVESVIAPVEPVTASVEPVEPVTAPVESVVSSIDDVVEGTSNIDIATFNALVAHDHQNLLVAALIFSALCVGCWVLKGSKLPFTLDDALILYSKIKLDFEGKIQINNIKELRAQLWEDADAIIFKNVTFSTKFQYFRLFDDLKENYFDSFGQPTNIVLNEQFWVSIILHLKDNYPEMVTTPDALVEVLTVINLFIIQFSH